MQAQAIHFWQLFFIVGGGIGFLLLLWCFLNRPKQLTVQEAEDQSKVAFFTTEKEWFELERENLPWRKQVQRETFNTVIAQQRTEQKSLESDRLETEVAMQNGMSLHTYRAQLLTQISDLSYVIRTITDGTLKIQDHVAQSNGQLLASAQAQMQKLEDERRAIENQIRLQNGLDVGEINAGYYNERKKMEWEQELREREQARKEDEARPPKKEAPSAKKN